jgi:hypothetical protein
MIEIIDKENIRVQGKFFKTENDFYKYIKSTKKKSYCAYECDSGLVVIDLRDHLDIKSLSIIHSFKVHFYAKN